MQIMIKGKGHIILPVITEVTMIEQDQNNEEFKTVTGNPLNLKGGRSLIRFSINSFLPSKDYEFVQGIRFPLIHYKKFFEENRDEVVRVIAVANNGILFNIQARYKFNYAITDKAGDIPYTLEITEYVDPNKKGGVLYDYI